jgi:hypothetical protein
MAIWKLVAAAALALNMGMARAEYTPGDFRAKGIPMPHLVLVDGSTASITFIGDIDPISLASFRALLADNPRVRRVYIDSPGGQLPSALAMARLIDERNLALVVDGRCFSACANFVFVAARRKTVLPGSMVGIHEMWSPYIDPREKNMLKSASGNEAEKELRALYGAERMKGWEQSLRQGQEFNREFGIRQELHEAYAEYVSNRKKSLGRSDINAVAGNPHCPRLRIWLLNRQQLAAIGVKGIDDFWFPRSEQEKQQAYKLSGLPPDSLYLGEAAPLQAYCKGFGGSAVVRQWYALRGLFKG